MSVMPFLEVNGTLHSGHKQKWFQLPETCLAARSLRFGKHVLLADKTMQILPLGEKPALRPQEQNQPEAQISWLSNWLVNLAKKQKALLFSKPEGDLTVRAGYMVRICDDDVPFSKTFRRLFHNRRIGLRRRKLSAIGGSLAELGQAGIGGQAASGGSC